MRNSAIKRMCGNNEGITLLEMMIVIVIISILAAISVIGFRMVIGHQRLIGETNTAISAMKFIGDEARVRRRVVKVRLDYEGDSILAWLDIDDDDNFDPPETLIHGIKLQEGVNLYSGRIAGQIRRTFQVFGFYNDGTTQDDILFVLRSDVTEELRGIKVNAFTGWPQLVGDIPEALK